MGNKDLDVLKKKYGEKFAQVCRTLFPTILETEGLLTSVIMQNFHESKFLIEDILLNHGLDEFKDYVLSFIEEKEAQTTKVVKSPFELMEKAGYNLYKCETNEDIYRFLNYYAKGEEICTFIDDERINKNLIFFAVKKNVHEIRREDFKSPARQDAYGTSVISLQFKKNKPNTLSIMNRYNHRVVNPDATFSNNLENIIPGLTESFAKEYKLNFIPEKQEYVICGYEKDKNGKLYKCNHSLSNNHYCVDNIVINSEGDVIKYDKNDMLLIDYFLFDLKNKTLKTHNEHVQDSFSDYFKDLNENSKIQVRKDGLNKIIIISQENREDVKICIDKYNKIIEYENNNLVEIDDRFLRYNTALKKLVLHNVKKMGQYCLPIANRLGKLDIFKIEKLGEFSFYSCNSLEELNVPNLKKIEETSFSPRGWNSLKKVSLRKGVKMPKALSEKISSLKENQNTGRIEI